jgi:hypothetical protein
VRSARFDDRNLVSAAGLVPVLGLADRVGLRASVDAQLTVPTDKGAHAGAKVAALVAGMVAGADSIEDMGLLRHGGMGRLFTGTYAPSTLGSFLRCFAFGHVRQLDAVAARLVANLAARAPVLPGSPTRLCKLTQPRPYRLLPRGGASTSTRTPTAPTPLVARNALVPPCALRAIARYARPCRVWLVGRTFPPGRLCRNLGPANSLVRPKQLAHMHRPSSAAKDGLAGSVQAACPPATGREQLWIRSVGHRGRSTATSWWVTCCSQRVRAAGRLLDHGLLGVLADECAWVVHAGEERGGEHHLVADLAAEQAGTAEAGDLLEVLGHLGLVVALVVVGCVCRGPSSPCPRDHWLHLPPEEHERFCTRPCCKEGGGRGNRSCRCECVRRPR